MNRKLSPFWTLFILTGLNLFNYFDRQVLSAVLPLIQSPERGLGLSDSQAGWLGTAFMLGYFISSPVFGYLGDRSSRKWLIAAGIFIWSLGTVLTGLAAAFAVMLAFRVLVGVGEASYATISPSYISDTYGSDKRNNALTIFYSAIPVGAALGYVVGGYIGKHSGWDHAFIWAGAPGLLLALCLLPFQEPKRGGADRVDKVEKPTLRDMLALFRLPIYLLVVGGYVAHTFAVGAFAHWGTTFLYRHHAMDQAYAATFFGATTALAGLVGTFAGGFAATAWRKRNPAAYGWVLGLSVTVSVPLAFGAFLSQQKALAMFCLAGAMFCLFLGIGPVNTLILETVPVNLRASAMAMSIFLIHLFGDMPSPLLVGWLSEEWGSLRSAVLILPVALMGAAALWLTLAVKMGQARPAQ